MQIYLPDDLYAEVKSRKLRASELFQHAVRAEIRLQNLIDAANQYLAEEIAESGEPSPDDLAWAEEVVERMKAHLRPPAKDEDQVSPADSTRKAS